MGDTEHWSHGHRWPCPRFYDLGQHNPCTRDCAGARARVAPGPGTAGALAALSRWVDDSIADQHPDAITWGRVSKVGEEFGEVIQAMIGWTGQNPRKGVTHLKEDVIVELLDVAVSALAAVEHLTENRGDAMRMLDEKVEAVAIRAGLLS